MDTVPHSASYDNPFTIYALVDPRDQAVRYIGMTYDVYQRMRQHSRCEGNNDVKNAWIQELQREQIMFYMHSLEKVPSYEQALERELVWIEYFRQQGANLTNISGMPVDPEVSTFKKVRPYKREQFEQLFFQAYTGRVVSVYDATFEEFDEFMKRYLEIEENPRYPGWPDFQRRQAINFAVRNQIELDFCKATQEGV